MGTVSLLISFIEFIQIRKDMESTLTSADITLPTLNRLHTTINLRGIEGGETTQFERKKIGSFNYQTVISEGKVFVGSFQYFAASHQAGL